MWSNLLISHLLGSFQLHFLLEDPEEYFLFIYLLIYYSILGLILFIHSISLEELFFLDILKRSLFFFRSFSYFFVLFWAYKNSSQHCPDFSGYHKYSSLLLSCWVWRSYFWYVIHTWSEVWLYYCIGPNSADIHRFFLWCHWTVNFTL